MLVRTLALGPPEKSASPLPGGLACRPLPRLGGESSDSTASHPEGPAMLCQSRNRHYRSLGGAGQLSCGLFPPRLALGARTLQESSLAPVQCIQQLLLQQLLTSSWLIPARIPGVGSFLVATENAEKNGNLAPWS